MFRSLPLLVLLLTACGKPEAGKPGAVTSGAATPTAVQPGSSANQQEVASEGLEPGGTATIEVRDQVFNVENLEVTQQGLFGSAEDLLVLDLAGYLTEESAGDHADPYVTFRIHLRPMSRGEHALDPTIPSTSNDHPGAMVHFSVADLPYGEAKSGTLTVSELSSEGDTNDTFGISQFGASFQGTYLDGAGSPVEISGQIQIR